VSSLLSLIAIGQLYMRRVICYTYKWLDDIAVPCEPGPIEFMVTTSALEGLKPNTDESDKLQQNENAPASLQNYKGPVRFIWR
jgi:hypothetical protein